MYKEEPQSVLLAFKLCRMKIVFVNWVSRHWLPDDYVQIWLWCTDLRMVSWKCLCLAFSKWLQQSHLRGHPYKLRPRYTPRLDCSRFAFAYRSVQKWNALGADVVCAPNIAEFKRRLHVSPALPKLWLRCAALRPYFQLIMQLFSMSSLADTNRHATVVMLLKLDAQRSECWWDGGVKGTYQRYIYQIHFFFNKKQSFFPNNTYFYPKKWLKIALFFTTFETI